MEQAPYLPSSAATLIDVTGTSSTNVLVAGDNGPFVRWNGFAWTSIHEPPGPVLNGVAASEPPIAVGALGYVYTGANGVQVNGGQSLEDVAATPTGAFIVGERQAAIPTLEIVGAAQPTPANLDAGVGALDLYAVWANAEYGYAGGAQGVVLVRTNGRWSVDAELGAQINAIAGTNERQLYAVGVGGRIWRLTP